MYPERPASSRAGPSAVWLATLRWICLGYCETSPMGGIVIFSTGYFAAHSRGG